MFELSRHVEWATSNLQVLSVFGLILYTNRHPHVAKVLADDFYWKQFDSVSGKNFAIFSAQPLPGHYEHPKPPPGKLNLMVRTWREPAENEKLLNTFCLDDTKQLPSFVIFAQMPGGEILQCSLPLSDQSVDSAHARLKRVVQVASTAADGISQQYRSDTENVYRAFECQLREFGERESLQKTLKWIPFAKSLLEYIKSGDK